MELHEFKMKLKQTNKVRYEEFTALQENYEALKLDVELIHKESTSQASKRSDSDELAFKEMLHSMTKLLVFGTNACQEKDKINIVVNQTCDQETPSINETLSQQWMIHKRKFLKMSTLFESSCRNIWKFAHEWNVQFSGEAIRECIVMSFLFMLD